MNRKENWLINQDGIQVIVKDNHHFVTYAIDFLAFRRSLVYSINSWWNINNWKITVYPSQWYRKNNLIRKSINSIGSGVFARDADAQVNMIQLNWVEVPMKKETEDSSATAWRLESSLRGFRSFMPVNIGFEYPIHRFDI
jgi:hypothetical protein